jgi:hypothetical protein
MRAATEPTSGLDETRAPARPPRRRTYELPRRVRTRQPSKPLIRRSRNQEGRQRLRAPDLGLRDKPWFAGRESGLARGPRSGVRSLKSLPSCTRSRAEGTTPRPRTAPTATTRIRQAGIGSSPTQIATMTGWAPPLANSSAWAPRFRPASPRAAGTATTEIHTSSGTLTSWSSFSPRSARRLQNAPLIRNSSSGDLNCAAKPGEAPAADRDRLPDDEPRSSLPRNAEGRILSSRAREPPKPRVILGSSLERQPAILPTFRLASAGPRRAMRGLRRGRASLALPASPQARGISRSRTCRSRWSSFRGT